MMDNSREIGSGVIDIRLPDVGTGEVYWYAYAMPTSTGLVHWHLDGNVTIEGTTKEFENLMMDDQMSEETIDLLIKRDRNARSYIVSAVASHTSLNIELAS